MSVTSSAYSRSPPTGRPARDPGHRPDVAVEALVEVHRRGLALERRVGGEDDLLDPAAGRVRLVDPGEELADLEPLGADAVDRADRAVEHVVAAAELAGALDGEHVQRLLDDAQPAVVAARVAADRAQRRVADVEAAVAEHDLVADGDQRPRERARLRVGRAQQVVRQALGRLGADARAGARTPRSGARRAR